MIKICQRRNGPYPVRAQIQLQAASSSQKSLKLEANSWKLPLRRQGFAHVHLDLLRLRFGLLQQFELQYARLVAGLNVLRIHSVRQGKGTEEAAIASLNAMEVLLLFFL